MNKTRKIAPVQKDESKKQYIRPKLVKREKANEVTGGVVMVTS